MRTFLALYRGPSLAQAELVGVSLDPEIVADVATHLLASPGGPEDDPVLAAKHHGDRRALRLVRADARGRAGGVA